MPRDTSTTQPNDESPLNGTREVTGVHSLPCATSALNDASSFGPIQLSMEFDGEEASDITDTPAHSDLPTIYDSQVLSQSFTFQVRFPMRFAGTKREFLQLFIIHRKLNYLLHPRMILKRKIPSMLNFINILFRMFSLNNYKIIAFRKDVFHVDENLSELPI
jgi:hypothetical protein